MNVQWLLERSTFAARRNLFAVKEVSNISQVLEPMVVQAEANVFADPFIETPRTSCMLSMSAAAVDAAWCCGKAPATPMTPNDCNRS